MGEVSVIKKSRKEYKYRCFGIVGEVPLDWVDLDNSYMYSQYRRKIDDSTGKI